MIKLTNAITMRPMYIQAKQIVFTETDSEDRLNTEISLTNGNSKLVAESPEEVARKVLEYRFKMERVKALAQRWANADGKEVVTVDYQLETWENAVSELSGLSAEKGANV